MAERKNLTITQVNEIQKVGNKQIPKLSFRARENDNELAGMYFTFKSSLFELIKEGQTITADVETSTREWEGNTYTDRKITQVYVDGQPISGKSQYRGKSPEELEQQARLMILAYSKDLVVAGKVSLEDMLKEADRCYTWLKVNDKVVSPTITKPTSPAKQQPEPKPSESQIDMDWLKESLEELQWADVGKWLKNKYKNAKGTTVKAIVESLTREQQEEFVGQVQERLDIHRSEP